VGPEDAFPEERFFPLGNGTNISSSIKRFSKIEQSFEFPPEVIVNSLPSPVFPSEENGETEKTFSLLWKNLHPCGNIQEQKTCSQIHCVDSNPACASIGCA